MTADHTRSAIENLTESSSGAGDRISVEDLREYRKVGIKGPKAVDWLRSQIDRVPEDIYQALRHEDGSLVARVGGDEVIIESPGTGQLVDRIETSLAESPPGVYRVEQQGTSLQLGGSDAVRVWRQTCGVDVPAKPLDRVLYTRVAGVSCGIIPEEDGSQRRYRIWVDYSYAPALYESLVEIVTSLGSVSATP